MSHNGILKNHLPDLRGNIRQLTFWRRKIIFFYVFFNSQKSKKGVKKMQKTTNEIKNVLDLSLIDHEFIVAMLNLILEEKEKQNGLSRN